MQILPSFTNGLKRELKKNETTALSAKEKPKMRNSITGNKQYKTTVSLSIKKNVLNIKLKKRKNNMRKI